tara:strand:+ start:4199 stop:4447 length:249 start_codon:yes stop_codon:yes gene_type:complete
LFQNIVYASSEGYDYSLGAYVEFDEGCFGEGDSFYMFDYSDGNYHYIDIYEMNNYNDTVQIEIYDYTKGELRYIDLESNVCD